MVLQHPLGDQNRVEVLVVRPDPLVGHLPLPPGLAGPGRVVPDDVDDPAGRVERLMDWLTGGPARGLRLLLRLPASTAGRTPADGLPLQIRIERLAWLTGPWREYVCTYMSIEASFCFIPGFYIPSRLHLIFGKGLIFLYQKHMVNTVITRTIFNNLKIKTNFFVNALL